MLINNVCTGNVSKIIIENINAFRNYQHGEFFLTISYIERKKLARTTAMEIVDVNTKINWL